MMGWRRRKQRVGRKIRQKKEIAGGRARIWDGKNDIDIETEQKTIHQQKHNENTTKIQHITMN